MTAEDDRVPISTSLGSMVFTLAACGLFVATGLFLVVAGVMAGLPRMVPPVLFGAGIAVLFGAAAVWSVVRTVRRGPVLVLTPTGIESHGWLLPWDQVVGIGVVAGAEMASPLTRPRMKWVGLRLRDPAILGRRADVPHDPVADRFTVFATAVPGDDADLDEQVRVNREHGGGYDFVWPSHLLPGPPGRSVELITEYGERNGMRLED